MANQEQEQEQEQDEGSPLTQPNKKQRSRSSKVEQDSTPDSGILDPDSEFDGHIWCLKTIKAHPLWKTPDAVDVPVSVSDAYTKAVECEAKRFNGDKTKAADDILAKTKCCAAKVKAGTEKAFGTIVSYFNGAIYNCHPPTAVMQAPIRFVKFPHPGPCLRDVLKGDDIPDWLKPKVKVKGPTTGEDRLVTA